MNTVVVSLSDWKLRHIYSRVDPPEKQRLVEGADGKADGMDNVDVATVF